MSSGIYKIFSKLKPERFYIGSAVNLKYRKWMHFHHLKQHRHHNLKLQSHFNKYGIEDLTFEVLELVEDKTKLIEREQFYIDSLNPFFNICKIAGSSLGVKRTEEYLKKLSDGHKGKKQSEETKQKRSNSLKGHVGFFKDKYLSEEHKEKIGLGNKGKTLSLETKKKISESHKGQSKSEEHKRKISETLKGRKRPQEILDKIKLTKAQNPYKPSKETKLKILETKRRKKLFQLETFNNINICQLQ